MPGRGTTPGWPRSSTRSGALSPGQRAALFLRYQADLPVHEVARLMGTSSGVVRMHLMRGRRRLAAELGDDDD